MRSWNIAHAGALLALATLFAGRVAAQLVQRLWPSDLLPDFEAWQSGLLPYPLLLSAQLAILLVIGHQTARIWRGRTSPKRGLGAALLGIGAIYMAGAAVRLAAGATFLSHDPFFAERLPSLFHMVLAAMVLVLGNFHFNGAVRVRGQVRPGGGRGLGGENGGP